MIINNRPYSQACENNQQPIFKQLKPLLANTQHVLEIGSGTGQHAVYFSHAMPHLMWQTSDRTANHPGINAWMDDTPNDNLLRPIELDVLTYDWNIKTDAVYSANTAHIMAWEAVCKMFEGVGKILPERGLFTLYGPFRYNNQFTSDSNARFDAQLKSGNPEQGIRNIEDLSVMAKKSGLVLSQDINMPANNQLLIWQKIKA